MTHRDRFKTTGFAIATVIVIIVPLFLAVTEVPSAAISAKKTDPVFAGYALTQQVAPTYDSASANFTIPTVTCSNNSNQTRILVIQLEVTASGSFALAYVQAECYGGSTTYEINAAACAEGTGCGSGCSPESVSAGDLITVSGEVDIGDTVPTEVSIQDSTSSAYVSCEAYGTFSGSGAIYAGMCEQNFNGPVDSLATKSTSPPTPEGGCQTGSRPAFTPVQFTGVMFDSVPLASSGAVNKYNMVSGSIVEIKTSKISSDGESFTETFEHHGPACRMDC